MTKPMSTQHRHVRPCDECRAKPAAYGGLCCGCHHREDRE